MGKQAFSIKGLTSEVAQLVAAKAAENYTGNITFEVNMKDGGIGSVKVQSQHTIKGGN